MLRGKPLTCAVTPRSADIVMHRAWLSNSRQRLRVAQRFEMTQISNLTRETVRNGIRGKTLCTGATRL